MRPNTIVDDYKPCMECDKPGKPKSVLVGRKVGVKVQRKATGELVGYLHANCRDEWTGKNDESKFSFEIV